MDSINKMQKIREIIIKILECEEDIVITPDTVLVGGVGENDLSLSSIDYVEFIVETEEAFDIIYDFEEQITTIRDLLNYIENYSLKGK